MMTDLPGPVLWQRLDLPGHDAAMVEALEGGAAIEGMAVFADGEPTALAYRVVCDDAWRTLSADVRGRRGARRLELAIRRSSDGTWTLNGKPCPAVAGCVDVDLNFSPCTNLLPLRRLDLGVGAAAEVRAAWLQWPEARLLPLRQTYRRRAADELEYTADVPGEPFAAVLRAPPRGWVLEYGGLWRAL
ncbi:MAG TPA: putative glycolipid-binding domain-containing protein [Gemmatimonadales bacterium]|nr:putative glycolipid-binding domain-containing protein [Gemmatimonadales bacterium]